MTAVTRQLHFSLQDAPPWLVAVDGEYKYTGTPEPGSYDFTVSAHVTENNIDSEVSEKRLTGLVQFQPPIWQTPAQLDAAFTNIDGAQLVNATSFAASVDYYQTESSSSDLALGQGGTISYNLTQPGANTITVEAVALASADSLLDTSSLDRSATLRQFMIWALQTLDSRSEVAIVSDITQSLVETTPPVEMPLRSTFAASAVDMDDYCDTRAVLYAVGPNADTSSVPDTPVTVSLVTDLDGDGVDSGHTANPVFTHTVGAAADAHVIGILDADGNTVSEHQVSSGRERGTFVAMFDRRNSTLVVHAVDRNTSLVLDVGTPAQTCVLPESWTGAELTDGNNTLACASVYVTTPQDPRVNRILGDLVGKEPSGWPLGSDLGGFRVGQPMSHVFAFSGRTFTIQNTNAPGLEGTGGAVVFGSPSEVGAWYVRVRALEDESQLYSSSDVLIDTVQLDWDSVPDAEVSARVADNIDVIVPLSRSQDASITYAIEPNTSGLSAAVDEATDTVTVTGTLAHTGLVSVSLQAMVTVRSSEVVSQTTLAFLVLNKLPIWDIPEESDIALQYATDLLVVPLSAVAPEPVTYRLASEEVPREGETLLEVIDSNLRMRLPDGKRSVVVEAVVDEDAVTPANIQAHAFDKLETRSLVDIVSESEAAIAQSAVVVAAVSEASVEYSPSKTHMTAFPDTGEDREVYLDGVQMFFAFDLFRSTGRLTVKCGGIDLAALVRSGDTSVQVTMLDSAAAQGVLDTPHGRGVCSVEVAPTGVVRLQILGLDVLGTYRVAPVPGDDLSVILEGGALVGSIHHVPNFDSTFELAHMYTLANPWFVDPNSLVYVHTGEPFQARATQETPEPGVFAFSIDDSLGISSLTVNEASAMIIGNVDADGDAFATVRATRSDSTWRSGRIVFHGLTLVWPESLQLGTARVGELAVKDFVVTSSYDVTLALQEPASDYPEFQVTNSNGAAGQLSILADSPGDKLATVAAESQGVLRTRNVTVLVLHAVPVWSGESAHSISAFERSEAVRVAAASSTGDITYSVVGIEPQREGDYASIGDYDGLLRVWIESAGQVEVIVRATTTLDAQSTDLRVPAAAYYDGAYAYRASEEYPDGPPIAHLIPDMQSRAAFDVLAVQAAPGEALAFKPVTDQVVMRAGGVLMYHVWLEESAGAGDGKVALRIPGLADIIMEYISATTISVQIFQPPAPAGARVAGQAGEGAAQVAQGTVQGSLDVQGETLMVRWDAFGAIGVGLADQQQALVVCEAPQGASHGDVGDVTASTISFDVVDPRCAAVGGYMLSTFYESSRVHDWLAENV